MFYNKYNVVKKEVTMKSSRKPEFTPGQIVRVRGFRKRGVFLYRLPWRKKFVVRVGKVNIVFPADWVKPIDKEAAHARG